jgi:hypothetical protein
MNKFYRLCGRLFGNKLNLDDYKHDAITLCAQEEQDVPPAVYLPEHLQRITGPTVNCILSVTMERMHDTHPVHAPTLMYPIGKTRLFGGGLWTHNNQFVTRSLNEKDDFERVNISHAVVTDADVGLSYFGHWMREVVPASLVGTTEIPSLSLRRPHYSHAAQYEQFFKLKTIYANRGTVDNLYLLSDFSQNSYKLKRYLTLRDNLKDSLKPQDTAYKGVFIARGQTGSKRALLNENEVITHLEKNGFDVIYPEKMTSEEVIRKLWNAKTVITVEGSAHNHAIYSMARTGSLLSLQPPSRFGIIIKNACDCLGIGWGFYVCASSNDGEGFYVDSFSDLDKIIGHMQTS